MWTWQKRVELAATRLLRYLPVVAVSKIGAILGGREAQAAIALNRPWVKRLDKNFRHFFDIQDQAARNDEIIRFTARVGRVYAEFMVMQKLVAQGRFDFVGEPLPDTTRQPVIVVGCHLANWELMGRLLSCLQRPCSALYLPPKDVVRHQLAVESRLRWPMDLELIPSTDPGAMRRISRALQAGRNLLLYIDEERDGYVHSPSLGRSVGYAGNRWFAARLAVTHGIPILPVHIERVGNARYRAVVSPLVSVSQHENRRDEAIRIANLLDLQLDQWVRAGLRDWYWLSEFDAEVSAV